MSRYKCFFRYTLVVVSLLVTPFVVNGDDEKWEAMEAKDLAPLLNNQTWLMDGLVIYWRDDGMRNLVTEKGAAFQNEWWIDEEANAYCIKTKKGQRCGVVEVNDSGAYRTILESRRKGGEANVITFNLIEGIEDF